MHELRIYKNLYDLVSYSRKPDPSLRCVRRASPEQWAELFACIGEPMPELYKKPVHLQGQVDQDERNEIWLDARSRHSRDSDLWICIVLIDIAQSLCWSLVSNDEWPPQATWCTMSCPWFLNLSDRGYSCRNDAKKENGQITDFSFSSFDFSISLDFLPFIRCLFFVCLVSSPSRINLRELSTLLTAQLVTSHDLLLGGSSPSYCSFSNEPKTSSLVMLRYWWKNPVFCVYSDFRRHETWVI